MKVEDYKLGTVILNGYGNISFMPVQQRENEVRYVVCPSGQLSNWDIIWEYETNHLIIVSRVFCEG